MSLAGIKILDLTRVIAGPFCTQLLGDMGAEVIKVETPKGDPMRDQGAKVNGLSWYFAGFNRNKRSIVLDLRNAKGMDVLRRMIQQCDVLVENFKAGTLARMGLPDEALKTLNPHLIVCHISGFGSDGPYASRPAFDFIAQAMSGFMATNGTEGQEPLRSGIPISDLVVGLYGAFSIAATVVPEARKRQFNSIDISLTDSLVSFLAYMASEVFATGQTLSRSGNDHPLVAPYGLFATLDGHIAVAPSNEVILGRLLNILGLQHLMEDERFNTNEKRLRDRDAIRTLLEPHFATRTTNDWMTVLNEGGVPAGPVLSVEEALDDPQIRHREMVIDVEHEGHGAVKMLGFPIKQSASPPRIRYAAPDLGQDGRAVLEEFGFTREDIETMQKAKAAILPERVGETVLASVE